MQNGHVLLHVLEELVHVLLLLLHHFVKDALDTLLELVFKVYSRLLQQFLQNLLSLLFNCPNQLSVELLFAQLDSDSHLHEADKLALLVTFLWN